MVSRIVIAASFVVMASVAGCAPSPPTAPPASGGACARGRTFIVVRHAEKAPPPEAAPDDPPLSERGRARAQAVATMFEHAGITRLVASRYRRTQETLAPLAERLHLPVDVQEQSKQPPPPLDELVRGLRASPDGAVVMVASHSNVLPRLVRELSGGAALRDVRGDSLADDDYSRAYVITEPCAGAPQVLELSSGS
jgi:broad specificity phosphatase PhoE